MQTTTNYGLTIYDPNDVTSYLTGTGWNGTMNKIDYSMKTIENKADKANVDLTTLEQQVTTNTNEINNLTAEVSDVTSKAIGNEANIAGLTNRMNAAENNIQQLTEQVGGLGTVYRGVLTANESVLAINIGEFSDTSLVDVYASVYPLAPLSIELRPASGGQPNICVTTWDVQSADVQVAVVIKD